MRNFKKQYKRPRTAWNSQQIEETHGLMASYGLRRRRELLRTQAVVRDIRARARALIANRNPEREQVLLQKLQRQGILSGSPTLDDVLALRANQFLDRRLQTLVLKRGMAATALQARQAIVHGHVSVAGRRTKFPSYLVPVDEEQSIAWWGKELARPPAPATDVVETAVEAVEAAADAPAPAELTEAAADADEAAEAKE